MRTKKTKLLANKGGSGGYTFRATLPVHWLREMGLNENNRDLKLEFDGKQIIIKNNQEEIKMMNRLLDKLKLEVEKEIEEIGFVDDSDNLQDRFIDEVAYKVAKEEILKGDDDIDLYYEKEGEIQEIAEELMERVSEVIDYNCFSEIVNGNAKVFYYKGNKKFDSLEELKDEFNII